MPKQNTATSTAEKIRAFLVARPTWTHERIAQEVGSTVAYVDNVASKYKRQGKTLPNRKAARAARGPEMDDESGAATSETETEGGSGLRLIRIMRLTPPPVKQELGEGWECDQCQTKGEGKAPAACPKCGGA